MEIIVTKKVKKLFAVGKWKGDTTAGPVWELMGIYDKEKVAISKCVTVHYFVGPITLNEDLPDKTVDWPGAYFPLKGA